MSRLVRQGSEKLNEWQKFRQQQNRSLGGSKWADKLSSNTAN